MKKTKTVRIGSKTIGGTNPVLCQSMTNTDTADVKATVEQILRLEEAGCDIVRFTVPDMAAAEAIPEIKRNTHIPLVADIHFDYRLAIAACKAGVDKIRINPGNIGAPDRIKAVADACRQRGIPIRIGVRPHPRPSAKARLKTPGCSNSSAFTTLFFPSSQAMSQS